MAEAIETLFIELRGSIGKLQQDMGSAVGVISNANKKITGIANGISKAIAVGFAGVGLIAINKFKNALLGLADRGEDAGSIAEGFRALGGSAAQIDIARKATLGMVSSFDLMRTASLGLAAGIPNLNENFATVAELGARVANTLKLDTKTAIDDLVKALSKGNVNALKVFGFELEGVKGKANVTKTAMGELQGVLQKFAPVTDSVANAHKALNVTFLDLLANIGIAINENPKLIELFRDLDEKVRKVDFKDIAETLVKFLEVAFGAIKIINNLASSFTSLMHAFDDQHKMADRTESLKRLGGSVENLPEPIKKVGEETKKTGEITENELEKMKQNWKLFVDGVHEGSIKAQDSQKEIASSLSDLKSEYNKALDDINDVNRDTAEKSRNFTNDLIGNFQTLGSSVSSIFGGGGGIFDYFNQFLDIISSVNSAIGAITNIVGLFSGTPAPFLLPGGDPNAGAGAISSVVSNIPGVGDLLGGVFSSFGFAKGGIIKAPTSLLANGGTGVMGESGPEAIMPLTSVGGKLGVMSVGGGGPKVVYNIDARGAAAGVEHQIMRALRDVEDRAVSRAINLVADGRRRGGVFGDAF